MIISEEEIPLTKEQVKASLEAMIFVSDKPLSILKMREILPGPQSLEFINECLLELVEEYEVPSHRGIKLVEVAQGWHFRTKIAQSSVVQKLVKAPSTTIHLSGAILEVLAIIAYRGPISKSSIDQIRGVDGQHLIRTLMDKRLVKIVGKAEEELGKPLLYGITQDFLDVFNLRDPESLPPEYQLKEVLAGEEVGQIKDLKNLVLATDRASIMRGDWEELESVEQIIRETRPDTTFTRLLKPKPFSSGEDDSVSTPSSTAPASGGEKKTPFEILEEFLLKQEIMEQNKEASLSLYPYYGDQFSEHYHVNGTTTNQ